MKKLLPLALLLAAGQAVAGGTHDVNLGCDVGSDWSVSLYRSAFLFKQENGAAHEVGIGGGRLFVDGKEITLAVDDQRRIADLEAEMRALAPELRQVGREAVDIAFTALIEVARGLSRTPDKSVGDLQRARSRALADIDRQPMGVFDGDAVKGIVEPIITRFVPDIVGGAVSTALKAAFSGEAQRQEFQSRMDRMERELDTRVDARAKALEPLAEKMCRRLERMDDLDNALEVRLPGGEPLQLLRVDPDHHVRKR
jgi:Protein of unknown function (DUF2884)